MIILAEIADKMPTILELWIQYAVIGIVLAAIGLIHRWVSLVAFVIGIYISAFMVYAWWSNAFNEPTFSPAVQTELGNIWIAHSLISALCPAVFTAAVVVWHWKRRARKVKIASQSNAL